MIKIQAHGFVRNKLIYLIWPKKIKNCIIINIILNIQKGWFFKFYYEIFTM